jgi:hypothetical protein
MPVQQTRLYAENLWLCSTVEPNITLESSVANMQKHFTIILLAGAGLISGGCRDIGPPKMRYDTFAYTNAISDSWKSQMLLNTVKIRYEDVPVFLDVTSVITQYQVAGELQGRLGWNLTLPTG